MRNVPHMKTSLKRMTQPPNDHEVHELTIVIREITDAMIEAEGLLAELALEAYAEAQRLGIELWRDPREPYHVS